MSKEAQSLEFIVRSITDHGAVLSLTLQQEIKTEQISHIDIMKQRIDNIKDLDQDTREVLKKMLPALLGSQLPKQNIAYSPIQMQITITRLIYERMGNPKVGEGMYVSLSRLQ